MTKNIGDRNRLLMMLRNRVLFNVSLLQIVAEGFNVLRGHSTSRISIPRGEESRFSLFTSVTDCEPAASNKSI